MRVKKPPRTLACLDHHLTYALRPAELMHLITAAPVVDTAMT